MQRVGLSSARIAAGLGAVLVVLLPQVLMPHAWIAAFGPASGGAWRLVVNAVVSLLFVPVLKSVSYRRRDWLVLAFVPGWQLVLAWRTGYRAALLPLRDWAPRPEERLRVRWLRTGRLWVLLPKDHRLRTASTVLAADSVPGS